ncbi:MAG: tetratricopeptide repeat protein [Bacteroidales bacterium]
MSANSVSPDNTKKPFQSQNDDEEIREVLVKSINAQYSDPEKSLEYALKALKLAQETKNTPFETQAYLRIANVKIDYGKYSEAWEDINKAIEIAQNIESRVPLANAWRVLGVWYDMQGDLTSALRNYHKALSIYQEIGDIAGTSSCYNNIGIMHYELEDYDSAIEFYQKSIEIDLAQNNKRSLSKGYCNIANVYIKVGKPDVALNYLTKAQGIDELLDDKQGLAATKHNIGLAYLRMDKPNHALPYFKESLKICEEINDQYRIVTRLTTISEVYLINGKITEAIEVANRGLDISREIGSLGQQPYILNHLIDAYKHISDYKKALETQNMLIAVNDSLFDIEKAREVTNIRTNYQVEQKQLELDKAKMIATKDRTIRNVFGVALGLCVILISFILHGYMSKQKKNQRINEQNIALEQANAEIIAQRDEVEAQRDMLVSQKQKLEEANIQTQDSLRYAQSIQAAILPSEKVLQQISSNFFVMMKPCELVSGDFFWAAAFDDYQVFGLADCTGHGVPGAFMSILGITALNDIVNKHRISKPSDILSYLRQSVIEALGQNDSEQLHKDGMDIALCVFNVKTRMLQFAGAGLPLWFVTSEKNAESFNCSSKTIAANGLSLCELKGDNMPVGYSPAVKPFTNHQIDLNGKILTIYLATDGFPDQFGGINRKKYGVKRFKEFIVSTNNVSMTKQKELFEREFEIWKGNSYQIDDTTIVGLKL